jgi:hypothetical protein
MTQIARRIRRAIRYIALGGTAIPQRIFLGQQSPQTEISVWLHGMASPLDVTHRHSMACAIPFTLCLAFDKDQTPNEKETERLRLKFCVRDGRKRVLGTMGLKLVERISLNGREFILFQARTAANYCMPRLRLWAHYLFYAYWERRSSYIPDIKLSFLEKRAMEVMFICPRPISLMSVLTDIKGNMFPVNVMGDIDNGYFAFALRETKIPAHLVEDSRRIALSSVPFQQGALAYQLGANHNKQSIDWYELPFETKKSKTFEIPVPVFACRTREMEVEKIHRIGSHTFFIARIVSDERFGSGNELFVIHGFYEAWRIKKSHGEWSSALAEDASIKAGASYKSSPV